MKDQGVKNFIQHSQKYAVKLWKRFSNYNNSKKRFVLYLIVLAIVLLLFPIVKINGMKGIEGTSYALFFSGAYFRSFIVIGISLIFLL